ncbi:hypothetical protein HHK36_015891 [Tetracentron sinense]|uniref:CID domain-containing protein n=1 Tax=Tetracentron sinense TaxID=13715 RepID=A0A835DE25_TETSI|nr:hypothetical protein HHK36_015891 [Tetracentron sinense]
MLGVQTYYARAASPRCSAMLRLPLDPIPTVMNISAIEIPGGGRVSVRVQRLQGFSVNPRRKGSEFVTEFWKVLRDALKDVIENGEEFGKNAALRLVDIWEERKVFGSRGQILKEELLGRNAESNNIRNEKSSGFKLKQSVGDTLEKIISSYEVAYGGPVDEEALLSKCRNALSYIEKVEKEIGGDYSLGKLSGSGFVEELQGQHSILRECIEQMRAAESSRASLVSHIREALLEQVGFLQTP